MEDELHELEPHPRVGQPVKRRRQARAVMGRNFLAAEIPENHGPPEPGVSVFP